MTIDYKSLSILLAIVSWLWRCVPDHENSNVV